MRTINIKVDNEAHAKIHRIKEFLGTHNLDDTVGELIRRFTLPNSANVKRAIVTDRRNEDDQD